MKKITKKAFISKAKEIGISQDYINNFFSASIFLNAETVGYYEVNGYMCIVEKTDKFTYTDYYVLHYIAKDRFRLYDLDFTKKDELLKMFEKLTKCEGVL